MNIEVTTTESLRLHVSAGPMKPARPLTDCDDATKRAALRAIAEHLGPEATIAALGTDANAKQFADAQTREAIADARFDPDKTPPAKCIEILRTKYDAIHEALGGSLEELTSAMSAASGRDCFMPPDEAIPCIRMLIKEREHLDGMVSEYHESIEKYLGIKDDYLDGLEAVGKAIRAAGYDPDEVGAAEVIEKLSGATLGDVSKPYESIGGTLAELESAMASAHGRDYTMPADTAIGCIMMLIEQRDTARAQLREWRETVGPLLGAWDRYDNAPFEDRPAKDSVLTNWIRHQSPKFRRLLSATPDKDSSSPNGLSNPEGDVASPVAAHGGRKSAALFDDSASKRWQRLYQETQARLDESAAEYDRLRKRVERAELDRDAWKAMAEGEQRRRGDAESRLALLEADRSEWVFANDQSLGRLNDATDRATRAEKRVEELQAELTDTRREQLDRERMWGDDLAKLRRAETAIAALRNVLEIRQRLDRGEVVPTTWMDASTQSAADALADYDAGNETKGGDANARGQSSSPDATPPPARVVGGGKFADYDAGKGGEATIEQPQARVEGICPTCIGAGWKTEQYVGNVAVRRSCPDCNGTGRAPVAEHAQCSVNPFSSRMCERGVKGCDVEHAPKQPSPRKPRDDGETYEIPAAPPDWPRTQKEPWRIPEHSPGAPRYVSEDEERRIQDAVDADMAGPAAPPDDTPEAIARYAVSGRTDERLPIATRIRRLVDAEGERRSLHGRRRELVEAIEAVKLLPVHDAAKLLEKRLRELEKGGAK